MRALHQLGTRLGSLGHSLAAFPKRVRRRRLGEAAIVLATVTGLGWILATGAVTAVEAVSAGLSTTGPTGVSGPSGSTGPGGASGAAGGPVFTSAASYSTPVGTFFAFSVSATPAAALTIAESGDLPDGVVFDPTTDTLSGAPSAGTEGTYPITFTASDGISPNTVQSFTLVIGQPSVISFPSADLPITDVGEDYSARLPTPIGGVGSLTYRVEWGDLPAGVTLDSGTGTISGNVPANDPGTAPYTTEVYDFEVTATDSAGNVASQYFYIIVFPRLGLPPANLPPAVPGETYYSLAIGAQGGSGDLSGEPYFCDPSALSCTQVGTGSPGTGAVDDSGYATSEYHYALTSGALPVGLSLDPAFGTITGTVARGAPIGTATFSLTVTDSAGASATQSFSIVITDSPTTTTTPAAPAASRA